MIRACVYADDHVYRASFDAVAYFDTLTLDELLALKGIDLGGDCEADDVAQHFDDEPGYENVTRVFEYVGATDNGFECHVCEEDVARWVRDNHPEWLNEIWPAGIGIPEPDATPYYRVLHHEDDRP